MFVLKNKQESIRQLPGAPSALLLYGDGTALGPQRLLQAMRSHSGGENRSICHGASILLQSHSEPPNSKPQPQPQPWQPFQALGNIAKLSNQASSLLCFSLGPLNF